MPTEIDVSPSSTEAGSPSTTFVKDQILNSLKTGKEYRRAFVEESVRTSLAAQIKAIREQRKMTRPALACAMGKAPSWIFRLEDPNEKPPTVTTLLAVADAFDTDLQISFCSFASLLDRLGRLSPESFEVPSFEEELPELEKCIGGEDPGSVLNNLGEPGTLDWDTRLRLAERIMTLGSEYSGPAESTHAVSSGDPYKELSLVPKPKVMNEEDFHLGARVVPSAAQATIPELPDSEAWRRYANQPEVAA